ncbi:MAG: FkbM family methyltransferase [Bacteroidota bacterium]
MNIIQFFRQLIRNNHSIRSFVAYNLASSGLFDKFILDNPISEIWKKRIEDVKNCPDNEHITRVADAGKVVKGKQIMHNGLKIHLGSYYGPEVATQLIINKGVHEPQEEYVFQEVLKAGIRKDATMVELGAFWSFYSMWFNSEVENAKNYMVEPDKFNMGFGIRNFKLNKMNGNFTNAFVSSKSDKTTSPETIYIDDFVNTNNIDFIDILHSDIQGYEFEMLKGAESFIDKDKIGYLFISTHANDVHYDCLNFLSSKNYLILVDIDVDKTFSIDGLIVARSKNYHGLNEIKISLKEN